jgi:hypothetical protein
MGWEVLFEMAKLTVIFCGGVGAPMFWKWVNTRGDRKTKTKKEERDIFQQSTEAMAANLMGQITDLRKAHAEIQKDLREQQRNLAASIKSEAECRGRLSSLEERVKTMREELEYVKAANKNLTSEIALLKGH